MDEIICQTHRISRSVTDLLGHARPRECTPTRISPQQIVERSVHLMRPRLTERTIELHTSIEPGTRDVLADEEYLVQILLNLLLNAEHAMDGRGTIRLVVAPDPLAVDFARVVVADNGRGMSREVLERAGQPFYTTRPDGTGLGILLSRDMLERMGGDLHIQSRAGSGTVVTVRLPAAFDEPGQ